MYSSSIYLAINIATAIKPLAIWCFMSAWAIGCVVVAAFIIASIGAFIWCATHTPVTKDAKGGLKK